MKATGRRIPVALAGLLGAVVFASCAAATGMADTYRSEVELSTRDVDAKEVALGDLLADAIRTAAHADVAFVAAATFSDNTAPIRPGAFSPMDVLKMVEYRSEDIAILKLSGEQIRDGLEHGLFLFPKANISFLQTSGLTMTVNEAGESDGHILAIKIANEPLVPAKIYHVAMPLTLANGALAYSKYWKKSDIEKDTGKTLETALVSYLNDHKVLAKGDDRLVVKGGSREAGHG